MGTDLQKIRRKVTRGITHPGWFVSATHRRLLPKDPTASEIADWQHGVLPRVPITELFQGLEAVDVKILRTFDRLPGTSILPFELMILVAIVKLIDARNILEIGTFDGNTALNLAANSAPDAAVTTVDLPPDWDGQLELDIPSTAKNVTDRKKLGAQYKSSEYSHKVTQVLCDSAKIDWDKMPTPFDLVFIDGCHFYDYVRRDTDNAIRYLKPGGVVAWHDYGSSGDVSRAVDETAKKFKVRAIQGSRLAVGIPRLAP